LSPPATSQFYGTFISGHIASSVGLPAGIDFIQAPFWIEYFRREDPPI
jgi:hypothetical protein